MKRKVTLRDVADAAGFHISTVSRALDARSRHMIAPESVERIQEVSRRIGYRHNAAAVALKTSRTRMIGVVVPDITNLIFPPIIRGIEDALAARGYLAIVGNTDNEPVREEQMIMTLLERGVDGFILASVELQDEFVDRLVSDDVAIVTLNRRLSNEAASSVVHHEDEGIRRVLTHLVSLGHTQIASIAGPQHLSTGVDRLKAFERYRAALRLPDIPELVAVARFYNEAEGERCLEELLASGVPFTAVACANDRLAIGAIQALSRRGLRCPDDISVTGFNDMPMVDRLTPPLTTVRISQYEIGYKSAELLAARIEGDTDARPHIVLPIDLIIRGSTAAPGRASKRLADRET